jgi:hypothetical protein
VSEILTIDDLRRRWGLPTNRDVARVCRERGVPVLRLGRTDLRVSWRRARFLADAIADWERANMDAIPAAARPEPPRAPKDQVKRLGNWRKRGDVQ